jgi:hypothetical protein
MIMDLFGGKTHKQIDPNGLDRAMVFTALLDGTVTIHMFEKKGEGAPFAQTPFTTTLKLRRQTISDDKMFAVACKVPYKAKRKKVKNVTTNAMRETRGTIHVKQQDITTIALKKRKRNKSKDADSQEPKLAKKSKPTKATGSSKGSK